MNIGIAGGGLIGRLLAWKLLKIGYRVSLFDSDVVHGNAAAARVAAAMLSPYCEGASFGKEIFSWGLTSFQQWPSLIAELENDSGTQIFFNRKGTLVVAHQQDQGSLDDFGQMLQSKLPIALHKVSHLDRYQLTELESDIGRKFSNAIFLQEEGTLDNRDLLDALAKAIRSLGGTWLEGRRVTDIRPGVIHIGAQEYTFDIVVDTRGFGAKADLSTLRGVRGEILWVRAPEVHIERSIRLMHPRYHLYISPKRDSTYAIGATEIESESLAPMSVRSSLELQSALYSVHSGFAEASILHAYANCRPAFPDNHPKILSTHRLIRVNGLYRHGFMLAPLVLEGVLNSLKGDFSSPFIHFQ